MIKSLKHTIQEFTQMGGNYIFSGSFLNKVLSFASSIIAIRLLSQEMFGELTYAYSIIQFFIPFIGLGVHFGLVRFSPLLNSEATQNGLYKQGIATGSVINIVLFAILMVIGFTHILPADANPYFLWIIGIQIFTLFPFEMSKSHYRVQLRNKLFASMDLSYQLCLNLLFLLLIPFIGGYGYAIALGFTPLIAFFIGKALKKGADVPTEKINWPTKFWSYSIKSSFNSSASQLLFYMDLFLLGFLLQNELITGGYRTASILPHALSFVPVAFVTTHYVHIAKNHQSATYLKSFLKKYFFLFIPLAFVSGLALYFLAPFILNILFGQEYAGYYPVLQILSLGLVGTFCLRIPFGNLLAGVGLATQNLITSLITLSINLILNMVLIPRFGIYGAAWATTISLWTSGGVALLFFTYYLNKIQHGYGQNN